LVGLIPLLSFDQVSKSYPDGTREIVVLDHVSFAIQPGMFVGMFGARRSGKSTLLRLASGIEAPSSGTVSLEGRDLAAMSAKDRERLLRRSVALMSMNDWSPRPSERVVDYVALALGSKGVDRREARRRARAVLAKLEIARVADEMAGSLSLVERARVMLARAVIREPAVLLADEPALIPSVHERDDFCGLLRSVAEERKTTLVVASEDMSPLHGAGMLMSIGDGELCTTEEGQATVVSLPWRGNARAELGR
jgi:ABC-type lipoprotein export system ATPase subunit